MMRRVPAVCVIALLLGGCANTLAVPSWVPWLGAPSKSAPEAKPVASTPVGPAVETAQPGSVRVKPFEETDDALTDRVIAIVNNDAITLAELQESVATKRTEARQQQRVLADDTLMQDSLNQPIEVRDQVQEADREKITIEE